ncbi:uncharacterized protein LOC116343493 [Contarinia nasturtii]|uniref:uncharacterized protein LOC116343493 n=1 Tax=Contarinia nasturtii TaxID=265458 RepID=UPI0012D42A7C|nr:uncharacterized protein LOC116343493 [Contarinia nasturtii]
MSFQNETKNHILPTVNSPSHILNALNNDCIQAIFRKFSNVGDFSSASKVCSKFYENAIVGYPPKFKNLDIGEDFGYDVTRIEHVKYFLMQFGSFIKSIKFIGSTSKRRDNEIMKVISKFCGNTLKELIVEGRATVDLSSFQAIEELSILFSSVSGLQLRSQQLTRLELMGECGGLNLGQHFSKLEQIDFTCCPITSDEFRCFLSYNPQLKYIKLTGCHGLTASNIEDIAYHTPNIVTLDLENTLTDAININFRPFSKLRALKYLAILDYSIDIASLDCLYRTLAENDVPLEILEVNCEAKNIMKLKHLKGLSIQEISAEKLIDFVKNVPKIEIITTPGFGIEKITVHDIKEILKHGKKLKFLDLGTIEIEYFDVSVFNDIAALAEGRTKVRIRLDQIIPEGIASRCHSEWLDMKERKYIHFLKG